jgi:naphtho-gamma-pyrone polyketide synthase
LGEYAALYVARVLSADDAIYLVGTRAQLLVKHCQKSTHTMLAVHAPLAAFASELASLPIEVACINSPVSTTISGPKEAVQQLSVSLKLKNVQTVNLDLPYAFHSANVDPVLAEFEKLACLIHFHKPAVPYLSPLLSEAVDKPGVLNASYLVRATRKCVNFQGAIEAVRKRAGSVDSIMWLELGPHPACSGMLKQIVGAHAITLPTLRRDGQTWKLTVEALQVLYHAGVDIQWDEFHRSFKAAQCLLPLPSYKWSLQKYWIPYRNNFCLTKGNDPVPNFEEILPLSADAAPTASLSSSVHRIINESHTDKTSTLLIESDLCDSRMSSVITGHKVNTVMLCSSSLYADIAFTMAEHMLKSSGMLHDNTGLDCGTMSIQRPLTVQPDTTSHLLRVSAEADWTGGEVALTFYSVGENEQKTADHASCVLKVTESQNWLTEWRRNAFLPLSRVRSLHAAVNMGNAHNIKRGLAYKLFATLVDYSSDYRGMEQVILDSESLEATAQVKFQIDDQGFNINPCWIDSLAHIAGFIMNGNDNVCSEDQIFINHGWEAMRCAKLIQYEKTYTTYNRMQLESSTMYVGDTYVFEDDELVAKFEGVRVSLPTLRDGIRPDLTLRSSKVLIARS